MAPLPPGQPGLRAPGPPGAGQRRRAPGLRTALLVALSALAALNVADASGVTGLSAVDDAARAGLAAFVLFAVAGFGLVRLWLPDGLRRHELLWVLPVGACAAGVELALLGYARVPFAANLAAVLALGAVLGVIAVRRDARPPSPGASVAETAWPVWIGLLLICVALVPMFRSGFPTVLGNGSDAHLAVGTADFLQDHHPTAVAAEEPVDRVPLVWRSKPPIYYPLAAVATLSGLETWEAFPVLAALLMALAAAGFFLLARDTLGAGLAGAAAGMALVGLDRVVVHTTLHPYFNQLWGFFTLPFALVLAAWAVKARTRGAVALLALFLAVGAFAYPLALPIPLVALAALLWPERARLAAVRRLWRGPRSLAWILPLAALLAYPAYGIAEKAISAVEPVVDPGYSLVNWGGDLLAFRPEHEFVALPTAGLLLLLGPLLAVAIALELRRQPRALAIALGGVLVFGALAALWFRPRDYGWYFHFKALAFVGPLAVLIAAVAVSRLRQAAAAVALALLVWLAVLGATDELKGTFDQNPPALTELAELDATLPADASIRLDVDPSRQIWVAYFLSGQPLCSQRPLLETSYPHVPISRKADYVLADKELRRPFDATGAPLWRGERFVLYRQAPTVPGHDFCSQRMQQTVEEIL